MTAETDLPPLPEALLVRGDIGGLYSGHEVTHYARACVSSATEALRAEVDALRSRLEDTIRDGLNGQLRAERLAEALREMIELREATQRGEVHPTRHELDIVKDARALLRDQEEGK